MEKILDKHVNAWYWHTRTRVMEGVKILYAKRKDAVVLAGHHVCQVEEGDLILPVCECDTHKYYSVRKGKPGKSGEPMDSGYKPWITLENGDKLIYVTPVD